MKTLHELSHSNAVRGVEIFSPGTHNDDTYTEQDVDDIIAAARDLDFRPALKIGHTKDQPGAPAYGWITNLRKAGGKLVADFESMHDSVLAALRDRRYDRVSSEIYFNLKRGAKTFRRALKAVALLGAEVPAVAELVPLHKMEFAADGFEKLAANDQTLDVPAQAIVAALAAQNAALITLFNEKDTETMKTVAELKGQVKTLSEQIAALTASTDKDKDAKLAELKKQQEQLTKDLATAEQSEADRLKAEALAAENAKLAERVKALEAQDRASKVKAFGESLTIPALRPALAALYAHALELAPETKVKVFATDKDGKQTTTERSVAECLTDLVSAINQTAKTKLFSVTHDQSGKGERKEGVVAENAQEAGAELDRLAKEYMVKNPTVKEYVDALNAVMSLSENKELVRVYSEKQVAAA